MCSVQCVLCVAFYRFAVCPVRAGCETCAVYGSGLDMVGFIVRA